MMKFEHLKKIAEILVERKYADDWIDDGAGELLLYWNAPELDDVYESVDILSDTLAARRQLDVVEDYLERNKPLEWLASRADILMINYKSRHQWRLDRIAWCIEQLEENGK